MVSELKKPLGRDKRVFAAQYLFTFLAWMKKAEGWEGVGMGWGEQVL